MAVFPRSRWGRAGLAAGVGVPVAGYGVQVGRAGLASRAERSFSDADSRAYNRAADEWVAQGRSGRKRVKAKYYDRERRAFVRANPKSRRVRPTVRRWEDRFGNVQRMRQAKPVRPSLSDVLLHPVRSRYQSDRLVMERLVRGGSSKPVFRAMLLEKRPGRSFEHRRLSSWTPHEQMARSFAAKHNKYHSSGAGSLLANQPRGLSRSTRAFVVRADVKSANLAPLSRFGNVDERVSVRRVPAGQRTVVGKSRSVFVPVARLG